MEPEKSAAQTAAPARVWWSLRAILVSVSLSRVVLRLFTEKSGCAYRLCFELSPGMARCDSNNPHCSV